MANVLLLLPAFYKLYVSLAKCKFEINNINFLSFKITKRKIKNLLNKSLQCKNYRAFNEPF
ncbi:hypothetical protein GGTG_07689 [Gaeumannomyces tritici R3-111a-1]|uniref:Uncharacterized protein n=1 Tax=Gaeumannomyces tritici (strain R3-111a-1) TaxID=644352 RepID=J3P2E2_GAET3|nr:hypothetical protein GGTG_07689 [Gaeumannomyces tritici R3-111a-1]EJT73834.1 hypothetical protein GGTG_07689 [Gaeumannomyces tritici R3-111a-1]